MESKMDGYYSTALEKGLRILSLFSQTRQLSLGEIARGVGTTKTSAYRFVNTLAQLGYLSKDPRSKLVSLGTNAFILGSGLARQFGLYHIVKSFVDEACNTHNVTVEALLFDSGTLFTLYRRETGTTLTYRLPNTTTALTSTAVGKCVLAFLPPEEQVEVIKKVPPHPRTEKTLHTIDDIMDDLRITKERGYALNDEEFMRGLLAIGAPLINLFANRVVGAVCFDFAAVTHTITDVQQKYSRVIVELGQSISRAIPG
jgi:DNA-binding IclR family transcriptional regulator